MSLQPENIKDNELLKNILNSFPNPVFIVDDDVRVKYCNKNGLALIKREYKDIINQKSGDLFNCLNGITAEGGCGTSCLCGECVIRNSVNEAIKGRRTFRKKMNLFTVDNEKTEESILLITTQPFLYNEENLVLLIIEDVKELEILRKLIPICSYCKKVRDDKKYWQDVENYFENTTMSHFSHGICPECLSKLSEEEDNKTYMELKLKFDKEFNQKQE